MRCSLLAVTTTLALAVAGCTEPADPNLAETAGALEGDESITNHDCHYTHRYYDNWGQPTTQLWWYCICNAQPANDPISWNMGGGYWTYPSGFCDHDYGNH